MANTKKTTVTTSTTKTEEVSAKVKETDVLKQQIEELKAQIALMSQMMNGNAKPAPVASGNKMITFINLVPGILVLQGSRLWKINGQFSKQVFSESEAIVIASSSANTIRAGYVYIDDADFVRDNNLQDIYNNIISADVLKHLFKNDGADIVNLYKSTTDEQKDIIVSMLQEKCLNGEQVDANVLKQISKLSGRDLLHIEPENEEE